MLLLLDGLAPFMLLTLVLGVTLREGDADVLGCGCGGGGGGGRMVALAIVGLALLGTTSLECDGGRLLLDVVVVGRGEADTRDGVA